MRLPRRVRMAASVVAGALLVAGAVALAGNEPSQVGLSADDDGVLLPSTSPTRPTTTVPIDDATTIPTSTTISFLLPPTVPGPSSARSGTPTTPPSSTARRLVVESGGTSGSPPWRLYATDRSGQHCVELEAKGRSHAGLLCNAARATRRIGDLVVVDVGGSLRALVAVASPAVTHLTPVGGADIGSRAGPDPTRSGLSYVGTILPGAADLLVQGGEHSLARLVPSAKAASVRADKVTQVDAKPYGVWAGYRRAGSTGVLWGGQQDIGFYDGTGGVRCVLYRRLGGPSEGMLAELCAQKAPSGKAIAVAHLVRTRAESPRSFHVLLVSDAPADGYTCALPSGASCSSGGGRPEGVAAPDPASTRLAFGDLASPFDAGSADHVTLSLRRGGQTIETIDVSVPA